jgi:hypothetical protein
MMFGGKRMLEQLNEQINSSSPCHVQRAVKPTFTWEEAIIFLQYCADAEYGEPIGIMNYKLPEAQQMQQVALVREYLNENLDNKIDTTQMCVTLSTKDNPAYKNDTGVILWNTHGATEFSFTDGEEEVVRFMDAGDLVYVPEGLIFKMKPLSARVFISFGLEKQGKE